MLDEAFQSRQMQPGETTSRLEADRYGTSLEYAHNLLERLVKQGQMTRRMGGRCVYYRHVHPKR